MWNRGGYGTNVSEDLDLDWFGEISVSLQFVPISTGNHATLCSRRKRRKTIVCCLQRSTGALHSNDFLLRNAFSHAEKFNFFSLFCWLLFLLLLFFLFFFMFITKHGYFFQFFQFLRTISFFFSFCSAFMSFSCVCERINCVI